MQTVLRGEVLETLAELYLVTANTEKAVDEYLLQNGVFLDQKTRMFLANIREVMGATSRRAKRAATAAEELWPDLGDAA